MRRRAGGLLALTLPVLVGWSFFDPFHENVEKGNRSAESGSSEEALREYGEAARVRPGSAVPDFNRGIVLSKDGKVEEARDAFLGAAAAEDPQVAADALYNLGNTLMDAEQFEPAVEAYLHSLDLDPEDADARRNLEIALRRQEQQEQQQQQQDQDQQKDEQNEDQQQQDQQQQEDEPEDDSRNEQPQPEDQEDEQQPQEQQPQPQEQMSREDAERLLNAVQSDELKVLQQMQDDDEEDDGTVTDDW